MDLTPDGPLGERDKDMNTLPTETVGTTHQPTSYRLFALSVFLQGHPESADDIN